MLYVYIYMYVILPNPRKSIVCYSYKLERIKHYLLTFVNFLQIAGSEFATRHILVINVARWRVGETGFAVSHADISAGLFNGF